MIKYVKTAIILNYVGKIVLPLIEEVYISLNRKVFDEYSEALVKGYQKRVDETIERHDALRARHDNDDEAQRLNDLLGF